MAGRVVDSRGLVESFPSENSNRFDSPLGTSGGVGDRFEFSLLL